MEQVIIKPECEFSLNKTMLCGQVFYYDLINPNKFRLYHKDKSVIVEQQTNGDLIFNCSEKEIDDVWEKYLQYNTYYGSAIKYCILNKPLDEILDKSAGLRILKQDPWEATLCFIISQNNNIGRIKSIVHNMVLEVSQSKHIDSLGNPFKSIPTPEDIVSRSHLKNLGLGYRDVYLYEMARSVYFRDIEYRDLIYPNNTLKDVVDFLTSFKGIGNKVANCIALFGLGYLDSYPIDRWIKRFQDEKLGGKTPNKNECNQLGVVQQYIFYSMINNDGSI